MEKKREGYRGSAGEGLIPYMTIFCYWGGIGKLLKLLLCPFLDDDHVLMLMSCFPFSGLQYPKWVGYDCRSNARS
jgi:hypothetical protein